MAALNVRSTCDEVKITTHDKEVLKQIFNQGLPYGDGVNEDELKDETIEDSTKVQKVKELEIKGVKAAEAGNVNAALVLFEQAVEMAPHWASAYNNRAQALRLKGDIEGAKANLNKAIELSCEKGTVACQAFVQRGLIRKREGDEEGAKADFKKAADLGNAFAKQILLSMNPYAALCNQMLSDVMHKLRSGQADG